MPLTSRGYEYIRLHGHPCADSRGRVLVHRLNWFSAYGNLPKEAVIHHKDGNRLNNNISNLEIFTRSKHMSEHYPDGFRAGRPPHNKGKIEVMEFVCSVCGTRGRRSSRKLRKSIKIGYRPVCSTECRCVLANRARAVDQPSPEAK